MPKRTHIKTILMIDSEAIMSMELSPFLGANGLNMSFRAERLEVFPTSRCFGTSSRAERNYRMLR